MTVQYRPPLPDEVLTYLYADRVGFGDRTDDAAVQRGLERTVLKPEWKLGAYEDGELVSQITTIPFVMRWGGREVATGGVSGVSTLPSHRRRGHLRELMRLSLEQMHAAGRPLAMLWASMAAIYQRFGYGITFSRMQYEFDPALLRFVDQLTPPGRVRMLKGSEAAPLLRDVYERYAQERSCMERRDSPELGDWWNNFVLRTWTPEHAPWMVAVYEEAAEALGYVIYHVENGPDVGHRSNQLIWAKELVWLTPASHRALVTLLVGYDLASTVRISMLPADDPLFIQVQEPRQLNVTVTDGTLVRIVDIPAALEQRVYPAEGGITFAVKDGLCPWNDGAWGLLAEGGSATVRRSSATPQLELDMRVLAILAAGHRSATDLWRAGLICAVDEAALAVADALFRPSQAANCLDLF